jgi:hypothetical protein
MDPPYRTADTTSIARESDISSTSGNLYLLVHLDALEEDAA